MQTPTTAETILIVDDYASLCELSAVILGGAGYAVHTATNAEDALQIARDVPRIDLLLCEIGMPDLRGELLAERFAALHPAAAVAFVSSKSGPIRAPAPFEVLHKPFTVSELRAVVTRALRMKAALNTTVAARA